MFVIMNALKIIIKKEEVKRDWFYVLLNKAVYMYTYSCVITLLFNIYVHVQYYYVVLAITENKRFSK